jgi:hypothetical protein
MCDGCVLRSQCDVGLTEFRAGDTLPDLPLQVYDLFDDVILLSEGSVVFHGPREDVSTFPAISDSIRVSSLSHVRACACLPSGPDMPRPAPQVLPFFESMGFKLPERKGIADFLQEVTSPKDQAVSSTLFD